jgi:hypothetical protein
MRPVDLARAACRDIGITPRSHPVRGGTDGSRLTEMGVPCPNLFTGMQEVHGPREYASTTDRAAAVRVALRLAGALGEGARVRVRPGPGPPPSRYLPLPYRAPSLAPNDQVDSGSSAPTANS